MLEPKSARTVSSYPSPAKLLSKKRLKDVWSASRDRTPRAGRAGVDRVSAKTFAANLDENLDKLTKKIKLGDYKPISLKAIFLDKPNSNKERMICIPTVADRLVQRAITQHLVTTKKFPIYNSSSFGFIKGLGTAAAIEEAKKLRSKHGWCLKTDIETFFDSIPRAALKKKVIAALGRNSLVPLISKFIDCEVSLDRKTKTKIRAHNIKPGVGIRQGMPLSPILANLILADFDKAIERAKIPMVRYADDLLLFFDSKEQAEAGHKFVKEVLDRVNLTIPEILDHSKTKIFGPRATVDFLGQELVYLSSTNSYVACVGGKQISKIRTRLRTEYDYVEKSKEGSTFQETLVELSRSIAAYRALYGRAHDFSRLDQNLRQIERSIVVKIFEDIFGPTALSSLDSYKKNYLGIGRIDVLEAANDMDPN